ncbi:4-phosphopantetheinyl transferase family protein [Candidatus Kaiserbacteria bacterium]|nr:4-phosphopantetheinyl transferase family protein [Candidatus Kaiserbacteria bacterium]
MTGAFLRCASDDRTALHEAGVAAARLAIWNASRETNRGATFASISVKKDASGKPHGRVRGRRRPVAVSISHSFPFAFAAAEAAAAVGADVERIRDFSSVVRDAFLTPAEREIVESAAPDERARLRTLCWSLKESVLKALGTGLRVHPVRVDLTPVLRGDSPALSVCGVLRAVEARSWRIGDDFVAAAVVIPIRSAYDWQHAAKR